MITYVHGDIFKQNVSAIIHSCNCFNTFGGGIAWTIQKMFPEAYQADLQTKRGDMNKLGTFSYADIPNNKISRVYNVYGQYNIGNYERMTNYAALAKGLLDAGRHYAKKPSGYLGIPYGIGCGLGGGDWNIVKDIIEDVFDSGMIVNYDVMICKI
jgi:O-acetyl-ADP-ribose deacetylase (regulator of RNase III)